MTVLTTSLDRRSEMFAANAAAMRALVENLREKVAAIREGGGEAARRRHLARGKLQPREPVRTLLDPGSPFRELSQLAAFGMYDGEVPAAEARLPASGQRTLAPPTRLSVPRRGAVRVQPAAALGRLLSCDLGR